MGRTTFALLTVLAWGVYGVFIHKGQVLMADPASGRYKAFLFVGVAYFLTAVLAPLAALWWTGATWTFSGPGVAWSLTAGIMGAIGAFGVLLAFGAIALPLSIIPTFDSFTHIPFHSLLGLIQLGLYIAAMVLLFRQNASAWFTPGKPQDQAP